MFNPTTSFTESNNPRTCAYTMASPDSPALEMAAATDAQARAKQAMQDRIADEAWAAQMEVTSGYDPIPVAPVEQPAPVDATATIECECGRIIPGNLNSSLFVKSPKTGSRAEIDYRFVDQLPPRVRRRIVNADENTRKARFTLAELKSIARVYELCKAPVKCEAGPMVSTQPFTFARRRAR